MRTVAARFGLALAIAGGILFLCGSLSLAADRSADLQTPASVWQSSMRNLDESGLTEPIDRLFGELARTGLPDWRQIVTDIMTGKGLRISDAIRAAARSGFQELVESATILGKIMLLGVCVACLDILTETLAPEGAGRLSLWATHTALIVLAVFTFRDILSVARGAMENLRAALMAFIPCLTSLALVSGAPVTAGVLHPIVFGMGSVVSIFVLDVGFPMVYTAVALDMAANLSQSERASGVADMLRQVAFLGIGLLMASFVGVVVGQRAAAGVADGVTFRTAKYVTSTFVPVAGKMIGDTMDMFFSATYALRSAMGLAGCIAVMSAVFAPFLRVLSCLAVWKVALAVIGPVSGRPVQRSLKSIADGIAFVAMTLLVTSFVFVICLSLVANAVRIT